MRVVVADIVPFGFGAVDVAVGFDAADGFGAVDAAVGFDAADGFGAVDVTDGFAAVVVPFGFGVVDSTDGFGAVDITDGFGAVVVPFGFDALYVADGFAAFEVTDVTNGGILDPDELDLDVDSFDLVVRDAFVVDDLNGTADPDPVDSFDVVDVVFNRLEMVGLGIEKGNRSGCACTDAR